MEEKIGSAAGQIWRFLAERKKAVNTTDLPKNTGLSTQLAYAGLGWLAREGKVCFKTEGQKILVGLAPAECCY